MDVPTRIFYPLVLSIMIFLAVTTLISSSSLKEDVPEFKKEGNLRSLFSTYHNPDLTPSPGTGVDVISPKKKKKQRNEEHHRKWREKMAAQLAEREKAEQEAEKPGADITKIDPTGALGSISVSTPGKNADDGGANPPVEDVPEWKKRQIELRAASRAKRGLPPDGDGKSATTSVGAKTSIDSSQADESETIGPETTSSSAAATSEVSKSTSGQGSALENSSPLAETTDSSDESTGSEEIVNVTPSRKDDLMAQEKALSGAENEAVGHSGIDTTMRSGLYKDNSIGATSGKGQLAKGKKAALFQVHFEGNLGDQMETIPLLQRLYEWGLEIDCYLSMWRDPKERLNPIVKKRVEKYVTNFYVDGIPQQHIVKQRGYDIIIVTPGPTVNELTHCIGKVHMAWFGVSVTNWAIDTYAKHKPCLKLIAVREELSYDKSARMLDPHFGDVRLLLSGDMSFSYRAIESDVNVYKKKFQDSLGTFLEKKNWVLIFSRENNFGSNKGIFIEGKNAIVTTVENTQESFALEDIVFASSSHLEDESHMAMIKSKHHFQHNRLVTFDSIEEMWALISLAPHVVTDRYHPGIATIIIGAKLTLTNYPNERVKMEGLHRMKQYSRDDMRAMNEKAFERLLQTIHRPKLKEDPIQTAL